MRLITYGDEIQRFLETGKLDGPDQPVDITVLAQSHPDALPFWQVTKAHDPGDRDYGFSITRERDGERAVVEYEIYWGEHVLTLRIERAGA